MSAFEDFKKRRLELDLSDDVIQFEISLCEQKLNKSLWQDKYWLNCYYFLKGLAHYRNIKPFTIKNQNMKVGDIVKKIKGYQFTGEIVAVFQNSKGDIRVVVEHFGSQTEDSGGMLHIFNTKQLQVIT